MAGRDGLEDTGMPSIRAAGCAKLACDHWSDCLTIKSVHCLTQAFKRAYAARRKFKNRDDASWRCARGTHPVHAHAAGDVSYIGYGPFFRVAR
jgi:hypothetical protein